MGKPKPLGVNDGLGLTPAECSAGAVAGLIVHQIRAERLQADVGKVAYFLPVRRALHEAALRVPGVVPYKEEELDPARVGTALAAWHVYEAMILAEPATFDTEPFRKALFEALARQPEICAVVANELFGPPAANPRTEQGIAAMAEAIVLLLRDPVERAVSTFLEVHGRYSFGFYEWALSQGLTGADQAEVKRVRAPIEGVLALLLLGSMVGQYRGESARTLAKWVRSDWRFRNKQGEPVGIMSILGNQLLGAHFGGRPEDRSRGALRGGLVTSLFRDLYGLPLRLDREVPLVDCPSVGETEMIFSTTGGEAVCAGCRKPVADSAHVVRERRNIDAFGYVLDPLDPDWRTKVRVLSETRYPIWFLVNAAHCPTIAAVETALAALVLADTPVQRKGTPASSQEAALLALASNPTARKARALDVEGLRDLCAAVRAPGGSLTVPGPQREELRHAGASLERARKAVQKRLSPAFTPEQSAEAVAALGREGFCTSGLVESAVLACLERVIEQRRRLHADQPHYVFSSKATCGHQFVAGDPTLVHGCASEDMSKVHSIADCSVPLVWTGIGLVAENTSGAAPPPPAFVDDDEAFAALEKAFNDEFGEWS